jgi:two-component system sensor kinase FixL
MTMKTDISDTQLRAIFETAVEGIITINKNGDIQEVNPAGEIIFGYQSKELFNENIKYLMPEPYRSEHDHYISSYQSSNNPKIIGTGREVLGLRKNGQEFPMWLSVAEYHEDGKQYFAGFIKDLSTEKSYIKKILGYEFILEHSLNEIYIFEVKALKFIHINKGALNNLQYSSEEMLNKTPVDIKPDFTHEKFLEVIQPLINTDIDKLVFTTSHQRKDGSIYPVEVHLELTNFGDQKVFVAFILDITERMIAQNNKRISEEQLAHMDRISIFGELAAGIAHEVNQPLTAINAYAKAGLNRIDSDELDILKIKELFVKINTATDKVHDVIKHLRMMLKPRGKEINHLNINDIIHDAIDLMKTDSRSVDFNFDLQLSSNIPNVLGDSVQLQQVILNLIRNSMDASIGKNGKDNEIVITSEELSGENRVEVSIQDSGCGVSSEIEGNLFTPFETTKEKGMGVGLSICQTIIQSHNGRIWYTKNTNKGSTFHFTILTALDNNHG